MLVAPRDNPHHMFAPIFYSTVQEIIRGNFQFYLSCINWTLLELKYAKKFFSHTLVSDQPYIAGFMNLKNFYNEGRILPFRNRNLIFVNVKLFTFWNIIFPSNSTFYRTHQLRIPKIKKRKILKGKFTSNKRTKESIHGELLIQVFEWNETSKHYWKQTTLSSIYSLLLIEISRILLFCKTTGNSR